ncbi:MAG: phenylalanine--tRNA ligase subunit beta [Pseudomonadota bacterium]
MKFTLGWLKDHLQTDAALEEILETLTDLGLEVEGVEDPSAALAPFKVGHVLEAEKHPDADKLRVCKVDVGGEPQQIICGAPNARAGIKVVVAAPGDYIPGIDTTISVGKIRGVESFGMMLSEREMQVSDEHDGIVELPDDAPVGASYLEYRGAGDPMIEIAITPNRPDALGVAGIARDLAARGLGTVITPQVDPVPGGFESPIQVTLGGDVKDLDCPLFVGRMIQGVKNGPSPQWLQDRLKAIGLRPISALVDVTNYLTYDRARPLHVFDADKVTGGITARKAHAGERLVALDEVEYTLDPSMTVIADEAGAEGIAGVMGGLHTGCTDETVNVFVEAAYFDPVSTAHTGRALKINSDARYRFERGIDPAFTPDGMELATRMILDLCGGEPSEVVVAGAVPKTARSYYLDPERVISLVGMDIPKDTQVCILTDLGFGVADEHSGLEVWVPSWRPDVQGEADLVEEVARVASLTKLEGKPMARPTGVQKPILTEAQRRERVVRRTLAACGLNECLTYSFVDGRAAALFGGGEAAALANPISADLSHMRPQLLPGLMAAAARNQARGFPGLGLFEVGPIWAGGEPEDQSLVATALRIGPMIPRNAHGSQRMVDLFDAKADAQATLMALGAPDTLMTQQGASAWFHPGRSGRLCLGPKTVLAEFGELHPSVLDALDVKGPAVATVIYPTRVPAKKAKTTARAALKLADLQAVDRDFAFIVDQDVAADAMVRAARGAQKALVDSVHVFDVFTGEAAEAQLGAGKKSVALSVRLQPTKATLTEADIEAASAAIIAGVIKATGAQLRG